MQPAADPVTYRVGTKSSEAPTKVAFSGDNNFILTGTRVGTVLLQDRRQAPDVAPVHVCALSDKDAIMDIELSSNRDRVLVTVGQKARTAC